MNNSGKEIFKKRFNQVYPEASIGIALMVVAGGLFYSLEFIPNQIVNSLVVVISVVLGILFIAAILGILCFLYWLFIDPFVRNFTK